MSYTSFRNADKLRREQDRGQAMNVTVRQHIFGNVPKDQSPRGRRGFQTLYRAPELTADDVLLLEERAQYFYSDAAPVKHQFYVLADGQAVVTQIVAVPEPDEYGRKGRYLAHSLIVPARAFQEMAYCPMPLLAARHFIADMATALAAGDYASGDLPPKTLAILDADAWASQALKWARQWPPAELEALARLGWQAAALRGQRQPVALLGEGDAVWEALSICFLLCSPAKRPALTFDTYAYRSDWSRDWPFWALARLEDGAQNTSHRIDGATRRVTGRLLAADDTPFERWVARQVIPERLEYLSAHEQDALTLAAVLAGRPADLTAVDPTFGDRFAQLNVEAVVRQVVLHLPSGLGSARRERLQQRVRLQPWIYLLRLARGFTAQDVAAELTAVELALLQARAPLADSELKALSEVAAAADLEELNNLLLLRGKDRAAWRRSLARLTEGSYRRIVEGGITAGFVTAGDAFVLDHLAAWCALAARVIQPGELKGVLRAIDKQDQGLDVDPLQGLWPALSPDDQRLLADWVGRHPGPAPTFRAALGVPEPDTPGPSLRARLRSSFGRKSSESEREE